ncbi:MAG: ribbon-helix-helix domain-containing protein [Nitrososphaeria archaeon]
MLEKEPLKQISFKCASSLILKLKEEAEKTNTTKTAIIKEAVMRLLQHDIDEIRELSRGTPPYSGKYVISIRLPESINTQLDIAAEKIRTNKSDLIRTAVAAYFKLV